MKIGKTLGIGTGTVRRVLMEQPRPFDVDVAEAAFASRRNSGQLRLTAADPSPERWVHPRARRPKRGAPPPGGTPP